MKNKKMFWIGGLLVALLVVGVLGATSVFAQSPADTPLHGHGPGGHGLSDAALSAAADVLNMTTDELKTALQSGKTLQQLADEAGVDVEDVRAAIEAVRETEIRDHIQQALGDGTITQEHADWLLE